MLSVANVSSPSAAAAYFAADNYYTGADADRSGSWVVKGAERLGLQGRVDVKQFDALLRGELPGGIEVGNAGQDHHAGLGKGNDLDRQQVCAGLARGRDTMEVTQTDIGADVDMAADRCRAAREHVMDHAA